MFQEKPSGRKSSSGRAKFGVIIVILLASFAAGEVAVVNKDLTPVEEPLGGAGEVREQSRPSLLTLKDEFKKDTEEIRYQAHSPQPHIVMTEGALKTYDDGGDDEGQSPFVTLTAGDHFPAMINTIDGLVFCPIAKVACAEWRKAFRWMLGVRDWENGPIHDLKKNKIPLLSDLGADEANHIINDRKWVKFVIVRDPEERLLSGFLNKCNNYVREYGNCPYLTMMPGLFPDSMKPLPRRPTPQLHAYFGKLVNGAPGHVFLHWARGVQEDIEEHGCGVNSHWRPQHCFCGLEKAIHLYDVFSFRNLTTVGVEVADKLVLTEPERKEKVTRFLKERFASNHDTKDKRRGASTAKSHFITSEISEIVAQTYARDYEMLSEYF